MWKWMNQDLALSLETFHRDAFGWACHCCGNGPADPADVLQMAYLKVMEGKARPRNRNVLKTWWFGVIKLTAREEHRRRRLRESLPGRWLFRTSDWETFPPPTTKIELDEVSGSLKSALARLPLRQAEVLHLVFYQDLSISEAAAVMGVTLGSARTHYERAKARLREILEPSSEP